MSDLATPILITGGTGFVGSHLVELLHAKGYSNIYVTSYSAEGGIVAKLLPSDHIIPLNLCDRQATADMLQKLQPAWIFHLASIATVGNSFEKSAEVFQNNISLQLSLLDAIKVYTPNARVLIVGSGLEYGHITPTAHNDLILINEQCLLAPTSPYAVSKVTQDLLGLSYFLSYGLQIVRVRPFNHIGERQTTDFAVPAFAQQIAEIEASKLNVLKVGNLDGYRDFSDVKDMVEAYYLLMQEGTVGDVYNVGSGKAWLMRDVLHQLVTLSSTTIQIEEDTALFRSKETAKVAADFSKIGALGWQPSIPLDQTLLRILQEWRTRIQG